MSISAFLIGAANRVATLAGAQQLNQDGRWSIDGGPPNPAVTGMWTKICQTMPFCGGGDAGPGVFVQLVQKIANFVFSTISGAAVVVMIYAAIKVIMSQGNEEGVTDAKKIAKWALGGLVLAMTGNAIVTYFVQTVVPASVG